MKSRILLACALLLAKAAWADPYSAAIRQAKDVSGRVTQANRQLMTEPQDNTNPPASQAANSVLQATLQNIQYLRADLATLARLTNSVSIANEKQGLTNDLAMAALDKKAQPASLSHLADDLAAAIAGNAKFRAPPPTFPQYLHAIFNASQLTDAQQAMIFNGVQKILTDGGAAPDDVTNVVNDIKIIASETK